VCSTSKVELVRSLGAHHVIDYTREDFTEGAIRYDVIIDTAGNRPLSGLRRALSPCGRLVIIGGENGGNWVGPINRLLPALLLSPFVGQKLGVFISTEGQEDLQTLREMVEGGVVTPAIDRTYPLIEAPDAVRYVGEGHSRGKVVVTI
jgi:NADPH:quinone reductase-like Zn-dependent oxidoreductase